MKIGCYLIFVRNEVTGRMRLTATSNPRACVEKMENLSGCDMSIQYHVGYSTVEEAVERKDVLKDALFCYRVKSRVDGHRRSQFGSWFAPEAWAHFAVAPELLEEAIEELYQFYDGDKWKLEDSLPA